MKTILLITVALFFFSCKKETQKNSAENERNQIKADILINGSSSHYYAAEFGVSFSGYVAPNGTTYRYVNSSIAGKELTITLTNINTTGSYNFGPISGTSSEANIRYSLTGLSSGDINYLNTAGSPSGNIIIDSLTTNYIKGSFTVTCWNGGESAVISNGSFQGDIL